MSMQGQCCQAIKFVFVGDDDVLMQDAEQSPAQHQRLRFIASINTAKNAMKDAQDELNKVLWYSFINKANTCP